MEILSYKTKEEILEKAGTILNRSLRQLIQREEIEIIEKQIGEYQSKRKGLFGELTEKYFFKINPGNISGPDFAVAGIELKTTPLKDHSKNKFSSKERLVFSMINYKTIGTEIWEKSTFLNKNKSLLLMFYLWINNQSILDYEFKFIYLLNLLEDISSEDIFQIQKDWEYIVNKIKRREAHLLSEADTYYLGACTKSANNRELRDQGLNTVKAKPRAFCFKQQYINYLIQTKFLGKKANTDSIFKKQRRIETIEEAVKEKFSPFLGKTDKEILSFLKSDLGTTSKSYKRLIVNKILNVETRDIQELEKANVTLRVITLEHTGTLRESISFPAFDYKDLVTQIWQDDERETMADFHLQLETKKFLFVVFQKIKDSNEIILRNIIFWNFPMRDLPEALKVWEKTKECVNEGRYEDLPKMKDSLVVHVRPHGKNARDTIETPQKTQEMKRCFWLNAKYIQQAIENDKDQA